MYACLCEQLLALGNAWITKRRYLCYMCANSFVKSIDASIVVIHYVNTHTHAVPPSPPLNVRVVDMSSTTLTLAWEEPVSTGGRARDELRYNLWFRAAGETNITLSNTVTTTVGLIGGM